MSANLLVVEPRAVDEIVAKTKRVLILADELDKKLNSMFVGNGDSAALERAQCFSEILLEQATILDEFVNEVANPAHVE